MDRKMTWLAGAAVLGGFAVAASAAPKADIATTKWQLDFEFHDPQRMTLVLPGDAAPTTFWYVLYQVTNHTGRDVQFYPSFRLVTDTLQVITGGDDISPSVYEAIIARHEGVYPFLAVPTKVTGLLLQGEDNARSSVAVFRDFDTQASRFTLYVAGLSAELVRVSNPTFRPERDESESNPRFYVLGRSLSVAYDLPGDPVTRSRATPVRRDRGWVMR